MADRSNIEWTETTWNPVTGCTKVSHGCKNCYAERMSQRIQSMGLKKYRNGFSVTEHPESLHEPLRWRKPRLVFVNSMSDLFHEQVQVSFVQDVFSVMNQCSQHTFQILTKRPLVPRKFFGERTLRGETVPHAIVQGGIGGADTEQVQADRRGRYAVRVPLYYGSTHSRVQIRPLGDLPEEQHSFYDIIPRLMLQAGRVEYTLNYLPHVLRGTVSAGIARTVTVRVRGGTDTVRPVLGGIVRILPPLYAESEYSLADNTGSTRLRMWTPSITAGAAWRRSRAGAQELSVHGQRQFSNFSVYGRAQRKSSPPASPILSLRYGARWHLRGGIHGSLSGYWTSSSNDAFGITPEVSLARPLGKWQVRMSLETQFRQHAVQQLRAGLDLTMPKGWHIGLGSTRYMQSGELDLRASIRLQTDWGNLSAEAFRDRDGVSSRSRAQGSVTIDRSGLYFSSSTHEYARVVFRVFRDANLNGTLDSGEEILNTAKLNMSPKQLFQRRDGRWHSQNLDPNETYTVQLLAKTIPDPYLHPATGYLFAVQAEAGHIRHIDIPLQPLPPLRGTISGYEGAPELLKVILVRPGKTTELDVFRGGRFYAQVLPGLYEVVVMDRLSGEILYKTNHTVSRTPAPIEITLR